MGALVSLLCSATFCLERILTWTCCAFLLLLLMFCIILLMVYGISLGYHYAQKELATFAMYSRLSEQPPLLRSGGEVDDSPVVRLLAVNRSEAQPQQPLVEVYETKAPDRRLYLESSETPIVILETEKSVPSEPELTANEKELARRLIGRFRRSRNNTSTTSTSFLRPLKVTTSVIYLSAF